MLRVGDSVKLQLTTENENQYGADQLGVVRRVTSVMGHERNPNMLIGVEPTLPDDVHYWHKANRFVVVGNTVTLNEIIAQRDKFADELEKTNSIYFQGIVEGLDIAIAILEYHDL